MKIKNLFLAFSLIVALGAEFVSAQMPTLVTTKELGSHEFHNQVTLVGRTEAKTYGRIVSEVSGRVLSIDATEGNPIKAGQTLITIDPTNTSLALKAKQAQEIEAKVQNGLAITHLKRVKELKAQNLVPESTLDSANAWVEISSAQYERLSAERQRLARDLDNCAIKAPFSGYTLRRTVDIGEWVNPGTPVYNLVDLSEIKVIVDLPQKYMGQLKNNSRADIIVSSRNDKVIKGKVSGISRAASEETHTFEVIITFANHNDEIGSGELVKATLFLEDVFTSFAVSKDAIVRNGLNTMVYTIHEDKAAPVPVITSSTDGELISIKGDGLKEGMPIVVRGNERIYPGAAVTTGGGDAQNQKKPEEPSETAQTESETDNAKEN